MFSADILMVVQGLMFVGSLFWFFHHNDEFPALVCAFLGYVFGYRYWAIEHGYNERLSMEYWGFLPLSDADIIQSFNYAVLGQAFLLGAYMMTQRYYLTPVALDVDESFRRWLKPRLVAFSVAGIVIAIIAQGQGMRELVGGAGIGFGANAYWFHLPLMLVSVAIFTVMLWKVGALENAFEKVLAIILIFVVYNLTFSPSERFKFLAWIIACSVIISSGYRPFKKALVLGAGLLLCLSLFGIAGAMRNLATDPHKNLSAGAVERIESAEDANMLDGFAYMFHVYPARLEHSWGMEHFEIVLRPIPRSLWPGKPVGGYMNKLEIFSEERGGNTVGFSPSLYGSFYAEGGVLGIIVLSSLYGYILGRLVRSSVIMFPMAGALVRAMVLASIIPLLRGGDLPGIYAWIGMSFWPIVGFLWLRRRELGVRII